MEQNTSRTGMLPAADIAATTQQGNIVGAVFFAIHIVTYSKILHKAKEPVRQLTYHSRLNLVLTVSRIGRLLELYIALASVVSCTLFVWDTYNRSASPLWAFFAELFVSISFLFQYFVDLYASQNRFAFVTGVQALVDKATVTPVLVSFFTGMYTGGSMGTAVFQFGRIMKFTRVLRLLRLLRSADAASSVTDDAIQHQLLLLSTTVTSILVITTGFVQYISNEVVTEQWADHSAVCPSGDYTEQGNCVMDFHDALYFTVITFTTVGYGDVAPSGSIGRLVILSLISATFVLVPLETSKLLKLLRLRSAYAGAYKRSRDESFVVVVADKTCTGVGDFIQELYHTDHGSTDLRVCLLVPSEPSSSVKEVLLKHKQVTFLKGDAVVTSDLHRAQITEADACFLLTDRFAKDSDKQDSTTVLRALNVKGANSDLKVFVQILQPENKVHCVSAGIPPEHVVCCGEIKFGLIGNSCSLPGFSTLLINLISSMSEMEKLVVEPWHEEYAMGLEQEIYSVTLPPFYQGKLFNDVAWYIYTNIGAMMFGVSNINSETHQLEVVLNPGKNYVIQPNQVVMVIANDVHCLDRIISVAGQDRVVSGQQKIALQEDEKVAAASQALESVAVTRRKLARASKKAAAIRRLRESNAVPGEEMPGVIEHQTVDANSPFLAVVAKSICADGFQGGSKRSILLQDLSNAAENELRDNLHLIQSEFYSDNMDEFVEDIHELLKAIWESDSGQTVPDFLEYTHDAEIVPGTSSPAKAAWRPSHSSLVEEGAPIASNVELNDCHHTVHQIREQKEATFTSSSTESSSLRVIDLDDPNSRRKSKARRSTASVTRAELAQRRETFIGMESVQLSQMQNHFVIICANMDDLQYLVAPIRLRYPTRPIVVICPIPPTRREWGLLVPFSQVYYLQGTRSVTDMKCAGIDQAMCAICLSEKPVGNTGRAISRHFSASDAEVILNVLDVECNPLIRNEIGIRTMCELNSNRYITGLGANDHRTVIGTNNEVNFSILSADSYIFETSYATGKVVAANFLESLLCQVFFNPCIIAVVNSIVSVPHSDYRKFATIDDFEAGYFDMTKVPEEFHGATYGEYLFHMLFHQGIIPIGLYRFNSARGSFVMTNPPEQTKLHQHDQVYVIMPGKNGSGGQSKS